MGIVKVFGLERDSTQFIGSAIQASCRDKLKLTKASVLYGAIKQVVVRVFSVLLLLASVWFWLDGSLPLAYGLILVITSFMVFNDLENARNMELNGNKKAHMKSICPCWILKNRRGQRKFTTD